MRISAVITRYCRTIGAALVLGALAVGGPAATARTGDEVAEQGSLLGSYLAGRIARGQHDSEAAAIHYRAALHRDPGHAGDL